MNYYALITLGIAIGVAALLALYTSLDTVQPQLYLIPTPTENTAVHISPPFSTLITASTSPLPISPSSSPPPSPKTTVATKPLITIIKPNGGETIRAQQTYIITWQAQGVDRVWISLVQGGKDHGLIAENIPAATGRYQWKVPADVSADFGSTGYKIFISNNSSTEEVRDESDGTFSIVK